MSLFGEIIVASVELELERERSRQRRRRRTLDVRHLGRKQLSPWDTKRARSCECCGREQTHFLNRMRRGFKRSLECGDCARG